MLHFLKTGMKFMGNLLSFQREKAVKLSYKVLRDGQFNNAMQKLSHYPFKRQKTAYDVMRITKKLEAEGKNAQELFVKMLKQHAKLDDKGEFVPRMEGDKPVADTYVLDTDDPSKMAAFNKAQEDFANLEFNLDWRQIAFENLEEIRLTAVELDSLKDVLAVPVDAETV